MENLPPQQRKIVHALMEKGGPARVTAMVLCWMQGDSLEAAQFLAGPLHSACNLVNVELDQVVARALASVLHIKRKPPDNSGSYPYRLAW